MAATFLRQFVQPSVFCRSNVLSSSLLQKEAGTAWGMAAARFKSRAIPMSVAKQVGKGAVAASIGLGVSAILTRTVYAEPLKDELKKSPINSHPTKNITLDDDRYPPPPQSSVSMYELGFGTVAGICAGVFVKKGTKALAWALGGVFVLLQYLRSTSVVRVDWGKVANKFEDSFHTVDAQGVKHAPNVMSLWRWIVDFLTADFQPRASFIAGFALGLRIG